MYVYIVKKGKREGGGEIQFDKYIRVFSSLKKAKDFAYEIIEKEKSETLREQLTFSGTAILTSGTCFLIFKMEVE